MDELKRVNDITKKLSATCLGTKFEIEAHVDKRHPESGRVYLQCAYRFHCNVTGKRQRFTGRKWYLSEYMTDDEIVKTAYCAYEAAVKHEIMEGFKYDGIILFNPHTHFEALLSVSHQTVNREVHTS